MPKQANTPSKHEQLLAHGTMLFATQGYHGTGLKELLDAVRIPKGSFYNYFASKEAFASEVIRVYAETIGRELDQALESRETDALGALRACLDGMIQRFRDKAFQEGCLVGNLCAEIGDTSPLCHPALQDAFKRWRQSFSHALARAQAGGQVRRDLSADTLADFLLNAWEGSLLRMKAEHSVRPLEQCRDLLLDYFFRP